MTNRGGATLNGLAALFWTTRPLSSLVAGTLSFAAVAAGRGHLSLASVAAGLAMTSLAMFGFAVNDIFDYRKDRAAGVRRPVAAGELSRKRAACLAAALLLCAGLLSAGLGAGGKTLGATALALLLYSPIAQRVPPVKGVFVAGLCCAPLWYGAAAGGVHYPALSYAMLGCFVLGREALMDSDEMAGDRRAGIETVAAVFGAAIARRAGLALMFLSAAGLAAIAPGGAARIAGMATLLSLAGVFAWPGLDDSGRIRLSRFPMLIGAVAIACAGA